MLTTLKATDQGNMRDEKGLFSPPDTSTPNQTNATSKRRLFRLHWLLMTTPVFDLFEEKR